MIYKMTQDDKYLGNGIYEIWCDNAILVEMEINNKGETRKCWLIQAVYDMSADKYKATYKSYTTK